MPGRMVLLGAGASVDAQIPATLDMTRDVIRRMESDPVPDREAGIARFVLAGLIYARGRAGERDLEAVDIENLYGAIVALGERSSSWLAPFVASWVPELEAFDAYEKQPSPFAKKNFIDDLVKWVQGELKKGSRSALGSPNTFQLQNRFEAAVTAIAGSTQIQGMFKRAANTIIQKLRQMVWIDDVSRVAYLNPLFELTQKQPRTVFATLNYDNCVEALFTARDAPLWNAIDDWSQARDLKLPVNGSSLLKLHGSIDWLLENAHSGEGAPLPHKKVRRATEKEMRDPDYQPAVVFGAGSKLTAEGPFLELLRLFSDALAESNVLTVIGYSFRDDHVNEYVRRWFNGMPDRRIEIVDRNFREMAAVRTHWDPKRDFVDDLLTLGSERLTVYRQRAMDVLESVLLS